MTDCFSWHPEARLYDGTGSDVRQGVAEGPVFPDSPPGLAAAIGHPAFRIGEPDQPPPVPEEHPVFETLTSGSTGQPRRIRRSQASWIASFAVNRDLGICPGARIAVLGRLIHSLALYGAVEGLHLGAEVHLLGGLRPDRQRQALVDRRITHLYATPAQLRLLSDGQGVSADLGLILVGGSKLDPATRSAVSVLAPGARVREFYGAAETSFVTISDDTSPEGSVGRPYPGVELVVDADGEVWVRSPYLFHGYAGGETFPDTLAGQSWATSTTRWREGWLSVGEIGHVEDDYLYLRGRAGRMVTVADQNVFPEEIEALLDGLPGINRSAVLPVADERRGMVLVAMAQGDRRAESAILARLRRELGPLKAPRALIWCEEWPTLASGKTDLRALEVALSWRG